MGKAVKIHLCVHVPEEGCPLGLAPAASTTPVLVIGDAQAMDLLIARGFTTEVFALSHLGSALGCKLPLRVSDIMRNGDEILQTARWASLCDWLLEIIRKNLDIR